jgi:hypothetical protein
MQRFLRELGRLVVHHIQLTNHFGRSPSFCKNEFCKKIDDYVLYFVKIIFSKQI